MRFASTDHVWSRKLDGVWYNIEACKAGRIRWRGSCSHAEQAGRSFERSAQQSEIQVGLVTVHVPPCNLDRSSSLCRFTSVPVFSLERVPVLGRDLSTLRSFVEI